MPGLQDYGKPVRKIRQTDGNVRLFFCQKTENCFSGGGERGGEQGKSPPRAEAVSLPQMNRKFDLGKAKNQEIKGKS